MVRVMDDLRVKVAGACVLSALVGFSLGNGHTTKAAIDGSNQWWQGRESRVWTQAQSKAWNDCIKDIGTPGP